MISADDFDDLLAVATEFIRSQGDGCLVSIGDLVDELGDRLPLSENTWTLLNVIGELWDNPHIDQVPCGWIDFAWNEEGGESRSHPKD